MATDRRTFWALGLLVATFLAGAGTGAGLVVSFGHRGPPRHTGGKHLPPPFEELALSPEQRQQVEAVFQTYRPRLEQVFEESRPRVKALRDAMDAELVPLLTESQRARFQEFKRERPGDGPPPPH